jgi:GntR family transcriptional regulator
MAQRRPPSFRLDFHSGLPAYLQIVRQVQHHVSTARLRPGDQLPTVRGLALRLGVNFNTVARAYRMLHRAGVVSTQRGRGTYVSAHPAAPLTRAPRITNAVDALAALYIAEARRRNFSEAQIAAMVARRLKAPVTASPVGENDA